MTANKQRLAIAKLQGIEQIDDEGWWGWNFEGIEMPGDTPSFLKVPDYRNDLEAMRKVLQRLDDEEWLEFLLHLLNLTGKQQDSGKWTIARALLETTAAQQATAYLVTKNEYESQ